MDFVICNYIDELNSRYGIEESLKVLVLKTTILVYPLLKDLGLEISAPIGLIIDSAVSIKSVIRDLDGITDSTPYYISIPAKEMKNRLTNVEYELVPILYVKSPNSISNLQLIQTACLTGQVKEQCFSALPILIFKEAIPEDAKDYLTGQISFPLSKIAYQFGSEESAGKPFIQSLILFISENWGGIKWGLEELFRDENEELVSRGSEFQGAELLYAAGKILELFLQHQSCPCEITTFCKDKLPSILSCMIDRWPIDYDNSDWLDIAQGLFRKAAASIPGILDRNHISGSDVDAIYTWPLYDDTYYYLSSKEFDRICAPITQSISMAELKQLLVDKGILAGEGKERKYRTVKVPVTTAYGAILEPRKLRLHREWLDFDGEPTWQELIEEKTTTEEMNP